MATGPEVVGDLGKRGGDHWLQRERTEGWRRLAASGQGSRNVSLSKALVETEGRGMGSWWREVPRAEGERERLGPGRIVGPGGGSWGGWGGGRWVWRRRRLVVGEAAVGRASCGWEAAGIESRGEATEDFECFIYLF